MAINGPQALRGPTESSIPAPPESKSKNPSWAVPGSRKTLLGGPELLSEPRSPPHSRVRARFQGSSVVWVPVVSQADPCLCGPMPSALCLPGRVAGVGEGQVAYTQHIEGTQDGEATVQRVAAFHTNEAGQLPGTVQLWGLGG